MSSAKLTDAMTGVQLKTQHRLMDLQAMLARSTATLPPLSQSRLDRAKAQMSFIRLDGSLGFHNPQKTQRLLDEARSLIIAAVPALARSAPTDANAVLARVATSKPTQSSKPASAAGTPAGRWIKTGPGETLWAIAARELGNGAKYPAVYKANRRQLVSPDILRPGTRLWIPITVGQ